MNDLPPNVDEILSLLGEIDIIKAALGSFDKSINIALASDPVSELIGPEGHFYILKKMEMIQAATVGLSVELLNIAEKVSATAKQMPMDKIDLDTMEQEAISDTSQIISAAQEKKGKKGKKETKDYFNPLVNNVLDYLNERLTTEDGDE
tara:strand:+ start:4504 stop:4950 length:447 start_codon:yes stop_codon:yes gene_type:complete